MQKLLSKTTFFVVSYEKSKSVRVSNFQQVEQKHTCTNRCKPHTQAKAIPKPQKTCKGTSCISDEDFDCVKNDGWLSDTIIDEYHKLLYSCVGPQKSHISSSTFVSQELRSIWCDDISVLPEVPRASRNWWTFESVILPVHTQSHWGAIAVDFTKKTEKSDCIVLDVVVMDSLRVYKQAFVDLFHPLQRYLALQYFALHGRIMGITFNYEFYHTCPNFIAQTDGSSCGIYTCLFSKALLFDVSVNIFKREREKRNCVLYELSSRDLIL